MMLPFYSSLLSGLLNSMESAAASTTPSRSPEMANLFGTDLYKAFWVNPISMALMANSSSAPLQAAMSLTAQPQESCPPKANRTSHTGSSTTTSFHTLRTLLVSTQLLTTRSMIESLNYHKSISTHLASWLSSNEK